MALPPIENLETLAKQRHQEVRVHGVTAAIDFMDYHVLLAKRESSGLAYASTENKKLLDLFIDVCKKMNLAYSLAVAYIKASSWEEILDPEFSATLLQLDDLSAVDCLRYAVEKKKWTLALLIVTSRIQMLARSVLNNLIHNYHNEPQSFPITEALLIRGRHGKEDLETFVKVLIEAGNLPLFEFMVNNDFISLSEVIAFGTFRLNTSTARLFSVLSMIMLSMGLFGIKKRRKLNHILHRAIETGLSTYHADLTARNDQGSVESPLFLAFCQDRLDIMRLLYRTGATTNAEVLRLKNILDKPLYVRQRNNWDAMKIYRYVSHAVKHPRRLQEICLLNISHGLGCRDLDGRRTALNQRLEQELPKSKQTLDDTKVCSLKNKILFTDALMDFSNTTSHHATDRDPPEVW